MAKWHWIVRSRTDWNKAMEAYGKGYTEKPEPSHIYSEGFVEGTRQEAIERAKWDKSSAHQIIEVKRVE